MAAESTFELTRWPGLAGEVSVQHVAAIRVRTMRARALHAEAAARGELSKRHNGQAYATWADVLSTLAVALDDLEALLARA